jgi:hypothetical protein
MGWDAQATAFAKSRSEDYYCLQMLVVLRETFEVRARNVGEMDP